MITPRPGISSRIWRALAILLLAGGMLAGCSTGKSYEAERGKQQDAENESVITDMQATHTWELINSTPDSTPDSTP